MNCSRILTALVPTVVLTGLAAPLATQRPNAGPLPHAGFSYFVADGTVDSSGLPVDHRKLLTRKPGTSPGNELRPVAPGRPDFRFASMFPDFEREDGIAQIDIDAFSIGLDLLWVDPVLNDGRIAAPTGDWLDIMFSVDPETAGAGPAIRSQQMTPEGAGADIFDFVPALSMLPGRFLNQTRRSVDALELDLVSTSPQPNITAIDYHVPLYFLDAPFVAQLPQRPVMFFSVTGATSAAVPQSWNVDRTGTSRPRSGANVYASQWDPATGWTTPIIFCHPAEFGLEEDDDIDSLAVDRFHQEDFGVIHIVYSTTGAPTTVPSEFLFAWKEVGPFALTAGSMVGGGPSGGPVGGTGTGGGGVTPVEYKDTDNQPIESKSRSGDRVVSVCVVDPFVRQDLSRVFAWGTPVSNPFATLGLADESLWGAAYRSCGTNPVGNTVPQLEFWLTGFGVNGPQQEMAACLVAFNPPQSFPNYTLVSVQNREPLRPLGDPRRAVIQSPAFASLQFQPVYAFWLTFAPGSSQIDVSNASMIQF